MKTDPQKSPYHLIVLFSLALLLVSGCQVREFASAVLNRDGPTNDQLLIPITEGSLVRTPIPGAADQTPPVITVWEGERQDFVNGLPQQWINVLGKAQDPETGIQTVTYALNGETQAHAAAIGPTPRRLVGVGDFNIELSPDELKDGENQLVITAVNGSGLKTQTPVTVVYSAAKRWPLPYRVDWSAVTDLQDAAQVVDGEWRVTGDGVRNLTMGYDRGLAIGDLTWKDYEVTVPVTVHAIDERAYQHKVSTNPGFGIILRWKGHTDTPPVCQAPPHCGWNPMGSSNWVELRKDQPAQIQLSAEPPEGSETADMTFALNTTYWLKARAETNPQGTLYSFKIWANGSDEPANWTLTRQADSGNLASGSLLLVAHHVELTFGSLTVSALP